MDIYIIQPNSGRTPFLTTGSDDLAMWKAYPDGQVLNVSAMARDLVDLRDRQDQPDWRERR